MDFDLTDEQRLLQDTVRRFVDDRILPNAVENDIQHHLDMEAIEGMAELGILGIVLPEQYGGSGLDFVSEALACEEIERGEAAFRTLISVHVGLNSLALLRYASEDQKQRWLVPQARGERIACFGLTEPAAGSDVAAMKSTARREGEVYVLNGSKNWISYANVADHALVFAKTDPSASHKGISAFVVERNMPGFTTAETENKLGIWAGSTGELFFQNVELPAENLIGEVWIGPGALHRCRRRSRRDSGVSRTVRRIRPRARDVRPADREVPVRPGHDRGDGAGLRDLQAARHASRVDEGPGPP
jgi:glutaryl-CoA dehydrogenase (non-decarboxylating)